MEGDAAAGAHPARQWHRWHEAAASRVAVAAELAHWRYGLRQAEVDEARRDVSCRGRSGCNVEGSVELRNEVGADHVGRDVLTANPAPQVVGL